MMARPLIAATFAFALMSAAPPFVEPTGPSHMEASTPAEIPLTEAQIIAMASDRYRRMTVPVSIKGEGPFRFMVDTGSQATAVSSEVSDQLALAPAGNATLVGMASRKRVELVEIQDLEIGESVFYDIRAPKLERRNIGADGIIGLDNLQDFRVLLDFRDNSLSLTDGQAIRDRRGYEIVVRAKRMENQLVITEALVDGVRAAVIIDTGSEGSIGNLALERRIRAKRRGEMTSTDVNGVGLTGDYAVVRSFRIDRIELTNLAIAFADSPAFAALGLTDRPTLSLGVGHLRMFDRVAIDFDKRQVLFDMPQGSRRFSRPIWNRVE